MDDIRKSFEYAFRDVKSFLGSEHLDTLLVYNEDYECYAQRETEEAYCWYSKGFRSGEMC